MMGDIGFLVVTRLSQVSASLVAANKHVLKTLYIQLQLPLAKTMPTPVFSKAVSNIYMNSSKYCHQLDVRVIVSNLKSETAQFKVPVDVLLLDSQRIDRSRIGLVSPASNIINIFNEPSLDEEASVTFETENYSTNMYENVVLGGTFDRLHIGHKLLLTEALIRTGKRLVVGVTNADMNKNKTLPELILPVEQRIQEVLRFIESVDSTIKAEVVAIDDPFGPTKSDPNMDLIVVSEETLKGGYKVNEIRKQNNLNELPIHCIKLVEDDQAGRNSVMESKISSSNQRMNILGTKLKPTTKKPHLPTKPYTIGLIGGIASGKSAMAQRLMKRGAGVIDCDKLAHHLYEPGQTCYQGVVNTFGLSICDDVGKIDRRKLGSIVFKDSSEMDKLNAIVWPALLKAVRVKIQELYEQGKHQVIVVEAAVLLKAGWQNEFHEIWSLIIPSTEAIRRLKERNNLSEQDAVDRVSAQTNNSTIVSFSDVVFSSMWSTDYSDLQAERAWKDLMEYLNEESKL